MSDFLLQLAAQPQARRLIRTLGLPIPLPRTLRRATGPWERQPLAGLTVVLAAAPGATLQGVAGEALVAAGAAPRVQGAADPELRALGEAFARPVRELGDERLDALVLDASGLDSPLALRSLYDFFHPLVPRLAPCGRVVVLGRPPGGAAQAALEGFVRSLAKERQVGGQGSTAQLVRVHPGAEGRLAAVLRFLLSPRAAFVTGQVLEIDGAVAGNGEPRWVRPLEGKIALVTGAARGIGEVTATLLAGEGAHVVCLDRPADEATVERVARAVGGSVLLADVADPAAPAAIARHLEARHGGVDILVHNAGVTRDRTLARMSAEEWDQALGINLEAIVRVDEALGGRLRDGGREICLSSVAGIAGNAGQTNYAASKAGVIGHVRQRAAALAGHGITVNAVAPGLIETRLTTVLPVMVREAARRLSALGQGGLPRDVAEAITFLASPGAVGLNGAVLRVCGGSFLGA
jgi:3-oxoacyl-[acyl-carrier protein] reductase